MYDSAGLCSVHIPSGCFVPGILWPVKTVRLFRGQNIILAKISDDRSRKVLKASYSGVSSILLLVTYRSPSVIRRWSVENLAWSGLDSDQERSQGRGEKSSLSSTSPGICKIKISSKLSRRERDYKLTTSFKVINPQWHPHWLFLQCVISNGVQHFHRNSISWLSRGLSAHNTPSFQPNDQKPGGLSIVVLRHMCPSDLERESSRNEEIISCTLWYKPTIWLE